MTDPTLESISVLAELDRMGWTYEPVGVDEVKTRCPSPQHADKKPSCSINTKTHRFKCHAAGCGVDGDFITFLALAFSQPRYVIVEELSQRYGLERTAAKPIDRSVVEAYHTDIWAAKVLLNELYVRGVSDESIRRYRLGFGKGRITIPIPNQQGVFVNVRFYMPGAPGSDKMKNMRGHGKIRLFPVDQLQFDSIIVCGGEIKAIVAAQHLNRHNIGAIAATSGEGNWEKEFSPLFRDKRVFICTDIDGPGRDAAQKLCARLKGFARWIGNVTLPLDPDKYPTGDINDYFGPEKHTDKDFIELLESVPEWKPQAFAAEEAVEEVTLPHLSQAISADLTGKRITVEAIVGAIDNSPYVVPREIRCVCDRSQQQCWSCPVNAADPPKDGFVVLTIPAESPAVLEMVAAPKKSLRDAIQEGLRIPNCKVVELKAISHYNVEDARLTPQLEISSRGTDSLLQPAMCIGHGLQANEPYQFSGRMYPHPRNQQSVLLLSQYAPTKDALSTYKPTDGELEELHIFQPTEWTVAGLSSKLGDIYDDLEANVTRIFQRRDLHFTIDLAYHSVMLLPFDKRQIKGWVEVLIAGDSSQGKSEASSCLMQHYGLGERVDCKNATVAGLLGGLQQSGGRWWISWGVIPTHDKRLVILEELKGADPSVIGHLTDMRSSGVAEIPKIEKRRTHARTRLIAISNPRSNRPLASCAFGIEVIQELIGGLEDIRRFDMALLLSAKQVSAEKLNELQRHRPQVKHRYTAELCRRCVLWAWTRTEQDVMFTENAVSAILDESTRLCTVYTEAVPLVDRGSMRYKLARLATSLACRTFSCGNKDRNLVIVRSCHVKYIVQFLDRIYSDRIFGYRDFSHAMEIATTLVKPDEIKSQLCQTPHPRDLVEALLHTNEIELRDICDWCGWEKADAIQLLSFLVRRHALVRDGNGYRKNPSFIDLLNTLRDSGEVDKSTRPDFIPEF